jgi:hypothetical protein
MAHDREFQRKRKDTRMPVRDSHGEDQPAVRQTEQDFDLRRARDTPSSVNGKTQAGHPCTDGIFPSVTGNTGVLAGAGRSVCNLFGWLFRSL